MQKLWQKFQSKFPGMVSANAYDELLSEYEQQSKEHERLTAKYQEMKVGFEEVLDKLDKARTRCAIAKGEAIEIRKKYAHFRYVLVVTLVVLCTVIVLIARQTEVEVADLGESFTRRIMYLDRGSATHASDAQCVRVLLTGRCANDDESAPVTDVLFLDAMHDYQIDVYVVQNQNDEAGRGILVRLPKVIEEHHVDQAQFLMEYADGTSLSLNELSLAASSSDNDGVRIAPGSVKSSLVESTVGNWYTIENQLNNAGLEAQLLDGESTELVALHHYRLEFSVEMVRHVYTYTSVSESIVMDLLLLHLAVIIAVVVAIVVIAVIAVLANLVWASLHRNVDREERHEGNPVEPEEELDVISHGREEPS